MTESATAARWVAMKNGEVVAEAETAKELFVTLHEKKITGSISQKVRATAAQRTEYAVSCGGDVSEHHFGGRSVTEDYNAAFDLLHAVVQRCKKGHHQVVSRTVEVGPWR